MNTFYEASSARQSMLMVFVFLALVFCLCSFFALPDRQKTKGPRLLNAGAFLALFALEAVMGQAFQQMQTGAACREILRLPMWALWCASAAVFLLVALKWLVSTRLSRQGLRRDFVKQAMDTLPNAICYFMPDGAVKLCNLQMHRMYRSLAQSDLQTLQELRLALSGCDRQTGVIRLSEELQVYLFPSGKAWRYSESRVMASDGVSYTEATFTDVTELYEDRLKLEEQTKQLEQIALELKLLSRNVMTAAKEQEVLSAKTTLHDQMGAGVLAVRRILQSGDAAEAAYALALFQKAARMIKSDNESLTDRGELYEFLHDADTIGVRVVLSGELPARQEVAHAFILAMRECLTNGVRHANASELRAVISQSSGAYAMRITNNGAVPKRRVVPKGGLVNLERTITNLCGTMEIQSQPEFMLTVTIPIEKEGA